MPAIGELAIFVEEAEAVLRLILAALLGGAIGLEREASGKPAGFRTNLLICLGAALITVISIHMARDVVLPGGFRADPGRIAAQIVSGVGFLGAGTILRSRGSVTGLTTAATLWVVAAIGIAAGAASYILAIAGTVLVLLALRFLGRFENRILPGRTMERVLHVVCDPDGDVLRRVDGTFAASGFRVTAMEVEKSRDGLAASFDTRGPGDELTALVEAILGLPGVRRVTLH
ncbi:MAG TPA: MgtC/SapB family protein [Longimicrobiales bacterium]|nr:MgtC/SapB family protein [Longimicrobiales bacterium]